MLTQFNDLSSWRKDEISIEAHEMYTLDFIDTMPNMFVIVNSNMARIKVGISSIPLTDRYEHQVDYNTTETFGRPIGTKKLYLLNDSSVDIKIAVFSVTDEFDLSILKNMNVSLDGIFVKGESEISGIRSGVVLPTKLSSTEIGKLDSIITEVAKLDAIKTYSNSIYSNIPKYSQMTNLLSKIDTMIQKLDTLNTSINNIEVSGGSEIVIG